jgi:hypothetical protein
MTIAVPWLNGAPVDAAFAEHAASAFFLGIGGALLAKSLLR